MTVLAADPPEAFLWSSSLSCPNVVFQIDQRVADAVQIVFHGFSGGENSA